MNYLAVIPARGGSKGILKKNISAVAGKPLIAWTIESALKVRRITNVVVSTDDPEIAEVAKKWGAEVPFLRPEELSKDSTPSLPVIQHAYDYYKSSGLDFDGILTLQPTSPLRLAIHLEECLDLFEKYSEADSLVSVTKVPHHMNSTSLMTKTNEWVFPVSTDVIMRRQDKPQEWCRNGAAIYITRTDSLKKFIWGGKTLGYEMDKISSIDIDDPEDLKIAEALLMHRETYGI